MNNSIVWRQFRDESKRSLPQKLVDMVKIYKEKTGCVPSVIGLPRGYGDETLSLLRERFKVELVVPRWAGHEVWLGEEAPEMNRDKQDGGR